MRSKYGIFTQELGGKPKKYTNLFSAISDL
jgi:hypothetical protein